MEKKVSFKDLINSDQPVLVDFSAEWYLLPDHELLRAVTRLGITAETPVLVYGAEPAGTMAAARLVWGLMYAGVKRIRLLDGGIDAWLATGGATLPQIVNARDPDLNAASVHGPARPQAVRPEFLATTAEVRQCVQDAGKTKSKLIDVRQAGEWNGTLTHYYPFFEEAGHIPTALYQGDWDTLLESNTQKLGPALKAVAQRWRQQGVIDSGVAARTTTLIFYCGTGWRSSVAFLVASLLGLQAKNYDSGFYGWSWHEHDKIAADEPAEPIPDVRTWRRPPAPIRT